MIPNFSSQRIGRSQLRPMISKEDIQKLGHLARLKIEDDEVAGLAADLERILDYVSQIEELNTEGVPITKNVVDMSDVTRPDVVEPVLGASAVEKMAPEFEAGHFVVPQVIG